jgi:hypothetical protein
LLASVAASLIIHPHYLAYFNWVSGGPAQGSEHLIDSNLDWGQDLVGLREWLDTYARGERVGIAYFGQINPEMLNLDDRERDRIDWFLPPAAPGTIDAAGRDAGPPPAGLYAVSASLVRGLPWRVYAENRWAPVSARERAFGYFARLQPIGHVGYSILLYRLSESDRERLAPIWR